MLQGFVMCRGGPYGLPDSQRSVPQEANCYLFGHKIVLLCVIIGVCEQWREGCSTRHTPRLEYTLDVAVGYMYNHV